MDGRIYLDNSASTRMHDDVLQAMLPYLSEGFGNPSSMHMFGRRARMAVEESRETLASCIGAEPDEIVLTSGGTESNNLAVKGVGFGNRQRGNHVIVSSIEHDSVLQPARWLTGQGFQVSYLPVDGDGLVDPADVEAAIRPETVLVSIIHGNNEIGTVQDLGALGAVCRAKGVYFHADACQSFTQIPLDMRSQPVDLLSINAHKIHGPKGVGALYVRRGVRIAAWQHGGGQERGLRSSTENVAGAVGFAVAAKRFCDQPREIERVTRMRNRILQWVLADIPGAYLNGHSTWRLPNNINLGFEGLEGEAMKLLLELDEAGIAVSTGSACSSKESGSHGSHVLTAIGRDPIAARGALRVSLGRDNTEAEIERFMEVLPQALGRLRRLSTTTGVK
jgi:cysteine desulfurase